MPDNNEKNPTEIFQINDVIQALQNSFDLLIKNWIFLIPALAGMIFSQILKFVAQNYFVRFEWLITHWIMFGIFPGYDAPIGFIIMVIRGAGAYFLMFVSLDMARNAYLKKEIDIMKSVEYVRKRIIPLTLASIIAFLFAFTIILIPLAILMIVIMIVDESEVEASITKGIKILLTNPINFLILTILIAIERVVLRYVLYPYTGHILTAPIDVLLILATMIIYLKLKQK
jgi:hypothetical protein